jgi:hypothetical protein
MSAFHATDTVRVLEPLASVFPGEYVVSVIDETGTAVLEGVGGFADEFLELVQAGAGVENPPVPAHITKWAFESRFTQAELVTIDLASIDDPSASSQVRQFAAALRVSKEKLRLAIFIDLTHPETVAGVQQLETVGLLATGRAAEILSTVIDASEAAA